MDCFICSENITNNDNFTILLCDCPYAYHIQCIEKWLKINSSCPNCRNKWSDKNYNSKKLNEHIRRRRNATSLDETQAQELQHRLFLESIGINSSQNRYGFMSPLPPLGRINLNLDIE